MIINAGTSPLEKNDIFYSTFLCLFFFFTDDWAGFVCYVSFHIAGQKVNYVENIGQKNDL